MTPQDKAALVRRGLGGQHLVDWLPGHDNKAARAAVVRSCTGGSWGTTDRQGVHGAGGSVTWTEVLALIDRGWRVPGLRAAYEHANLDWCAWAHAGGYSPDSCDWTEEDRDAHFAWYCRATDAIRSTTAAIVEAGCASAYEQDALF